MQRKHLTIIVVGALRLLGRGWANPPGETADLITIDASRPPPAPQTGKLHLGRKSPSGEVAQMRSASLAPQYELVVKVSPPPRREDRKAARPQDHN
jgi:hypothetical protein